MGAGGGAGVQSPTGWTQHPRGTSHLALTPRNTQAWPFVTKVHLSISQFLRSPLLRERRGMKNKVLSRKDHSSLRNLCKIKNLRHSSQPPNLTRDLVSPRLHPNGGRPLLCRVAPPSSFRAEGKSGRQMALDTDGCQWRQPVTSTRFRTAGPKVGSHCEVGTYHLQTTVQVRPARPQMSVAPSTRETTDARGSLPESGTRA